LQTMQTVRDSVSMSHIPFCLYVFVGHSQGMPELLQYSLIISKCICSVQIIGKGEHSHAQKKAFEQNFNYEETLHHNFTSR